MRWLAALALFAACVPFASHGGPVRDHVSFVDNLRARGLQAEPVRDVEQPFLRGRGTVLRVSGDALAGDAELESYAYDDTDLGADGRRLADEDARRLLDSRVYTTAPARFYLRQRVIVLYVGDDAALVSVLDQLLGRAFLRN